MAGKSTQLTLKVAAINATSRVFRDISSSASATIGKIAKWTAGLGAAYFSAKSVADSFQEMGKLSDVAQAAGSGVEELTKLSGALDMIGVKVSKPEELAAAFQRMARTTGQVGVEGFHRVVEEISKLPTLQERYTAAVQVFGKAGEEFMPVIEGAAKNGIGYLKDVEAAIPGISDAAAKAGDDCMKAFGAIKRSAAKIWNEGLMKVAQLVTGQFTGDIKTAALVCGAYMEYFARVSWRYVSAFFGDFKENMADIGAWVKKVMINAATVIGGKLVTIFENMKTSVTGLVDFLGAQLKAGFAAARGDFKAYAAYIKKSDDIAKGVVKAQDKHWKEFEDLVLQIDNSFDGRLAKVAIDDLKKDLKKNVANALKGGKALDKAGVPISEDDRAKLGALGAGGSAAPKNVNPEALLGGTYKAVTFALRAGYATTQEKIAKGVDKITELLKSVKDHTAEMADNLDFQTVEGY